MLYIVSTPIGNLADITFRAIDILRTADLILCEDTRVTKKLLLHFDISTKVESYHAHSGESKIAKIIEALERGDKIALVTDAGTPGISDPGAHLVKSVRMALGNDFLVFPIPGPSAFVAALSVSGFDASRFVFLGFLPHKKGRQTIFREISEDVGVVVFYESPHRIIDSLNRLAESLSPGRQICVAREITKIHEEYKIGTAIELLSYFQNNLEKVRGEFSVVVDRIGRLQ